MRRRLLKTLAAAAVIGLAIAVIPPVRQAALSSVGRLLTASDDPQPADFLIADIESGAAGALMVSDLFKAQPQASIGVFEPRPMRVEEELLRRGITPPNLARDVLVQLGIPASLLVRIPAGEAGTTETSAALAEWARRHPGTRVLVVVGPSHGRRYRRALRRVWPDGQSAPLVVAAPHALFRAGDWWQSRTTLREGLFEIQKLALDYARHPW